MNTLEEATVTHTSTRRPARAPRAPAPLFVVTDKQASLTALEFFLEEIPPFSNLVAGWQDKNKCEGIMLVDSDNKRIAVLICHTTEARDKAILAVQAHLGIESV